MIAHAAHEQGVNLEHMRAGSVTTIALLIGITGWLWLVVLICPELGARSPVGSWVGASLLVLTAIIAYHLRNRHPRAASAAVVGSTVIAAACALSAHRSLELAHLFVLTVIFASVLLGRGATIATATVTIGLTGVLGTGLIGLSILSPQVLIPMLLIALVAVVSLVAAGNLYTALDWTWNGYEKARANEALARERSAELRRTLKALDEATHRLERANYMLSLARDQAEEAHRLKQQFARTISHELRTPLNLIVGFTDLMARSPEYYGGPLSPAYVRDLSIVHRNAAHLEALVNDVLDLARIEAAQMTLILEDVDPAVLVYEAVNTARSLVEARGLALRTEIEAGLPRIPADPTRIRQVLFNLLNNAARFTEAGTVTVRVRREADWVLFQVADTGIGIAAGDLPRVFHEFQQLHAAGRRAVGGAGLGLAISREFVDLHGGRISVESQIGVGSVFSFTLPVARAQWGPGRHDDVPGPGQALDLRRGELTVLAVTRSQVAAALLTRYLRGYRTVVVTDLAKAQHVAQQLVPQAVILDRGCCDVPAASLEELARSWGLPSTPFVLCPLPGEPSGRLASAVDGYLLKPVTRATLWEALRQFGERVDRLLVVDDDHDFVRLVGRMLDSPVRQYQIVGAYTGQEALDIMGHQAPDLVLLDIMLPDMNGFAVVRRIRSNPAWRGIPIVVVSAHAEVNGLEALSGTISVAAGRGFMSGEIAKLVEHILTSTPGHSVPGLQPPLDLVTSTGTEDALAGQPSESA